MRVSVVGTGYLGTTHAAAMAELGHQVVAVDTDHTKIERLAAGLVPFYEPGLPELVTKHLGTDRLRFTTSLRDALDSARLHFICVGTPQQSNGYAADLTDVDAAFTAAADIVQAGSTVVGKSTVPVGTAARLSRVVATAGAELAWNPEFLREGFAVEDTLRPDRIVIGTAGGQPNSALVALEECYARIIKDGAPVVHTDFATAELVKVAANSFLATKISFINLMAEICEVSGGDVTRLAEAIGYDARIGHRFLRAGLGFGGGCLPKDIRAFAARAEELGVDQAFAFLTTIDEINQRRRTRMVELARELCDGSLAGRRVAVLGAAFKPDSDDTRDSPALDVAAAIQRDGAAVRVYDPQAMANAKAVQPTLAYSASAIDACAEAELVLHLTEWKEFRALRPEDLDDVVTRRAIIDGRTALDPEVWREAGWQFRALGRP